MPTIFNILNNLNEYVRLRALVEEDSAALLYGAVRGQIAHVLSALNSHSGRPICYVTFTPTQAHATFDDFCAFNSRTLLVPTVQPKTHSFEAQSHETQFALAKALDKISESEIIVMSAESFFASMVQKNSFDAAKLQLKQGEQADFGGILGTIAEGGYKRVDLVEGPGQFSVRGGIIDIFSADSDMPYRIEFFGDECDSIRMFDPVSQLSVYNVQSISIPPAIVEQGGGSILEYLPSRCIIALDEPMRLVERSQALADSAPSKYFTYQQSLDYLRERAVIGLCSLTKEFVGFSVYNIVDMTAKALTPLDGRPNSIRCEYDHRRKNDYIAVYMAGSSMRAENMARRLCDDGMIAAPATNITMLIKSGLNIMAGTLQGGFEYPGIRFSVATGKKTMIEAQRHSPRNGKKALNFSDLSVGDYVVHNAHGVGKYLGLHSMKVGDVVRDFLKIAYANSDLLYVPVSQLNLLYKFYGHDEGDKRIKLHSLGGSEWTRTKLRAKKNVSITAAKLLEVYAKRMAQKGHAFSRDSEWQQQFEAEFPYVETNDQLRSILDVKRDMESETPMDRLLCGDVGFGKTEVALRAAFKCVMDGMQCAYLAPTTVLAAQQYKTFCERHMNFPVNIEMLSRFTRKKKKGEILAALERGEVDILIGTHSILQKNVVFKRLGLLIVDEEQRFGVSHKERIKAIKSNVDVLTMTATPIPRTLHMSMSGIRDISLIAQSPQNRFPVQTYVLEYDSDIIDEAIDKELERNGQVFYLYNRVAGIDRVAARICERHPNARVAVGHGKLSEVQLEQVMMNFIEGESDILVCTTIIESGIDIPNVNTIIIENADCMGLAQLYQLRGRVGRSDRPAYAYITYRKDKALSEEAEKRLLAIRDYTELGSGFKIAMRDLEIRGAGNMLGEEQHGFMESIGYEMYCKLLNQELAKLKGQEPEASENCVIDLLVNAYIPEAYIAQPNLRIELYRNIAAVDSEQSKLELYEQIIDRYGDPPPDIETLIDIAFLRNAAAAAGIVEISQNTNAVSIYLDPNYGHDRSVIAGLIADNNPKMLYSGGEKPHLLYRTPQMPAKDLLNLLKSFIFLLKNSGN